MNELEALGAGGLQLQIKKIYHLIFFLYFSFLDRLLFRAIYYASVLTIQCKIDCLKIKNKQAIVTTVEGWK